MAYKYTFDTKSYTTFSDPYTNDVGETDFNKVESKEQLVSSDKRITIKLPTYAELKTCGDNVLCTFLWMNMFSVDRDNTQSKLYARYKHFREEIDLISESKSSDYDKIGSLAEVLKKLVSLTNNSRHHGSGPDSEHRQLGKDLEKLNERLWLFNCEGSVTWSSVIGLAPGDDSTTEETRLIGSPWNFPNGISHEMLQRAITSSYSKEQAISETKSGGLSRNKPATTLISMFEMLSRVNCKVSPALYCMNIALDNDDETSVRYLLERMEYKSDCTRNMKSAGCKGRDFKWLKLFMDDFYGCKFPSRSSKHARMFSNVTPSNIGAVINECFTIPGCISFFSRSTHDRGMSKTIVETNLTLRDSDFEGMTRSLMSRFAKAMQKKDFDFEGEFAQKIVYALGGIRNAQSQQLQVDEVGLAREVSLEA